MSSCFSSSTGFGPCTLPCFLSSPTPRCSSTSPALSTTEAPDGTRVQLARGRLLDTNAQLIEKLETVEQVRGFFDQLATTDDWLVVENIADCLDSVAGRDFFASLVDRVATCELTALIASTTTDGLKVLKVKHPRLLGFASVLDPADGGRSSFSTVVVTSHDRLDTGWEVVVRVKLSSPADLEADFDPGPDVNHMLPLVKTIHIIPDGERNDLFSGALIGFEPDAFTASQQELAFKAAVAAVKRVIGRPLNPGESASPSRGMYYT